MRFLDANIILRYLTKDDPEKAAACLELFQRVQQGQEELTTCEVIIHEVLYVLCSKAHYGLSHEEAAARLRPLLVLRGLHIASKRICLRALDLFANYAFLDFGDALAIAYMGDQNIPEIFSYDKHFDKIEGVRRILL
jgi:uncharacterized protein